VAGGLGGGGCKDGEGEEGVVCQREAGYRDHILPSQGQISVPEKIWKIETSLSEMDVL